MYKVLLVDDEKLFTDYLQSVIDWHAQGCEICGVAADGENALALARAQHPDVVLLDINIPLMDGLEVCRRLRAERVHCAVVIVSRSRISPTTMTSGSSRRAARRPEAKLSTSTPISRWLIRLFRF